jgi:hypothetical protein
MNMNEFRTLFDIESVCRFSVNFTERSQVNVRCALYWMLVFQVGNCGKAIPSRAGHEPRYTHSQVISFSIIATKKFSQN